MAFPLTINLSYGQEKVETSDQRQKLGTRAVLPDGRAFYYAKNSSAAISSAGQLVDGIALVGDHDMDLTATAAQAVGTDAVSIEVPTTDLTANQYKDGYLVFNAEAELSLIQPTTHLLTILFLLPLTRELVYELLLQLQQKRSWFTIRILALRSLMVTAL